MLLVQRRELRTRRTDHCVIHDHLADDGRRLAFRCDGDAALRESARAR